VVDFRYSTADASGMNLAVRATEEACRYVVASSSATGFEIFSGAESEKRASASLWSGGKGKWLVAGARVSARILRSHLRTDAATLAAYARRSLSVQLSTGTTAHCGQLANGLAAIFIACGQDVANVVNSATGLTLFEEGEDGALEATLTLPSLTVGTVGGGTALATASECLEMLGCRGAGKAQRFAEIVAAALLAGELSMVAAIVTGEHAAAHESLGRNRPDGSG
jgi:hydroxymethylglutaryl-CoA reductase (NADPH)